MTEGLDRVHVIDSSRLNGRAYFLSLATQARTCGLLSDGELARLETESLALLARKARAYTGGESTSLRAETARALLDSVHYTVGVALKACVSPEDAVERLRREPLEALEAAGQALISRKLDAARLLHTRLKQNLFDSENVFYRGTIVDGIEGFFRAYRPAFFAQETHITADYPPLNAVEGTGIEFVEGYLRALTHENRFLLYFPPERVRRLLTARDETWRLQPMNLVGPVLAAALLCELAGRPPRNLFCTEEDAARAVGGTTRETLIERFSQALERLVDALDCLPGLAAYLRRALLQVVAEVENLMRENGAGRLAFGASETEVCSQTVLHLGERMTDTAYARLLEELARCADAEGRAEGILRGVRSPADLFDVLRDASLDGESLWRVFSALPEPVLAALRRQYPAPELLTDEHERMLCETLSEFLDSLSPDNRARIEETARRMRVEI